MEIIKTSMTEKVLDLLKQVEEEGMTIFLCRYFSKSMYVNGGWVNIYKTSFLMNPAGGKLQLLHCENIPVAPDRHYFVRPGQLKRFTLYFPTIPKSWDVFDFVECTGPNNTGFVIRQLKRNDTGIYDVRLI